MKNNSNNKNKKNRKTVRTPKETPNTKNMINKKFFTYFLIVCLIVFAFLIIRIFWLQFIQGASLKEDAYKQQSTNRIISPQRGIIYDSTGKALAVSARVDTVSLNPKKVKYSNGDLVNNEIIAQKLSEIFELEYKDVLEKVSSDSSVVTIAKKVEQDKIDALKEWMSSNKITSGINIDEDTKRYYPYNNLASQLIGFCGNDNQGLEGLESEWDSVLSGTPGKLVTTTDSINQEIPDGRESYIPEENGSNITLTIDYYIQSTAEKYLKQAVTESGAARGGNVLIMQPSTGDILAMATYPDYDLNSPFTVDEAVTERFSEIFDTSTSAVYSLWKNRAVSNRYEPGSTFKTINAAIALEENIYTADNKNDFICTGRHKVADTSIACWKWYDPHGVQSLRNALENSCNPAFMQLAEKVGVRTLYKYYEAFGLFDKTGVSLSGEVTSDFHELENVKATELATMSFGQRFTITPLQLVTAVSAIANNGVLMQPRIVKEITNTDTGAVTTIEPVKVRQVISSETASQMMDMLESVVTSGTGKLASVKGYSVGGKTGTSEPSPSNPEEGHTVSYLAVSPTVNAQVVILVVLYDLPEGSQGGSLCGPVVKQILTDILPHLGIASDDTSSETNSNDKLVPEVRNKTITEAKKALTSAGFEVKISSNEDPNSTLVVNQVPKPGIALKNDSIVCLYTENNQVSTSTQVPNLKGMGAAQATNSLKSKNLNIKIEGSGIVVSQSVTAGESVEEGTVITVSLQPQLIDAH